MAKKKKLGFKDKLKTLEEIDQEYANLAGQVGHKACLIANTQTLIEQNQKEIDNLFLKMNDLQLQHRKLKEAQAKAKTPHAAVDSVIPALASFKEGEAAAQKEGLQS